MQMKFDPFPPVAIRDFEDFFNRKTLVKAQELVIDDAVNLLEQSSTHLTALVQGSEIQPYVVLITANTCSCTCPSDVFPCKHIGAVLLQAVSMPNSSTLDLTTYLQALEPIAAKTWLLELANENVLRPLLLKRLLVKPVRLLAGSKKAIAALKKVLEHGKNIEHETDLGAAAFAELQALNPEERSDEGWQLHELLEDYEIDYEFYDPYDESGDAYWEDRQSQWNGIALRHWATAESELGRGQAALETVLKHMKSWDTELWEGIVWIGLHQPELVKRIEKWLNQADIHTKEQFQNEFTRHFRSAAEYEQYLKTNLKHTRESHPLSDATMPPCQDAPHKQPLEPQKDTLARAIQSVWLGQLAWVLLEILMEKRKLIGMRRCQVPNINQFELKLFFGCLKTHTFINSSRDILGVSHHHKS
jgi:hypothetical protein